MFFDNEGKQFLQLEVFIEKVASSFDQPNTEFSVTVQFNISM
jgi:hypothetical protein